MAEEIERLIVVIESDIGDLVAETNKGVKETEKSLRSLEKTGKSAFGGAGKDASTFGSAVKGTFSVVKTFIKILKILALTITGLAIAMKLFPSLAAKFGGGLKTLLDKGKQVVATFKPAINTIENFSSVLKIGSVAASAVAAIAAIAAAGTVLLAVFGVIAVKKIVTFFQSFNTATIAANKQFETFTTQFETLLGSASLAKKRLEELTQFGVETPFELPEVVEASRTLEVFGGEILSTGDNLRMIGDIAAGVNRPFQEVALWIGRMFDALKSGRPFGEAAARLQEMGALSGIARAQLEQLQKEGADGATIWAAFNEQVGTKFAGNMERLSKTLGGIQSNLIDFRDNLIRIGGEEFFEKIKEAAERFLVIISNERAAAVLERIAKVLGVISTTIAEVAIDPLLSALEDLDISAVENLAESLEDVVNSSRLLVNILGPESFQISALVDIAAFAIEKLNGALAKAIRSVVFIQATIAKITVQLEATASLLLTLQGQGLGGLPSLAQIEAIDTAGQEAFNQVLRETQQLFDEITESQEEPTLRIARRTRLKEMLEETIPIADENVLKKTKQLATELLNLQEKTSAELEANEMEHRATLKEISDDAIAEALKTEQDADKELLALDAETIKEQTKIIDDAKKELAKLETNTDEILERERGNFNKEELRDTVDHLRSMRRLRLSFLDNLEDAVTARDAGRVRDLQRQFAREKQEREQDFSTRQGREKQDNSERLAEIRQAESDRSQEIMDNQAQQLRELEAHEAQQRQEITDSLAEQLMAIREESDKAALEERTNHQERQAELQVALDARLLAVAQELAAEENINREGAKKILGTLSEFFGKGGQVDVLMNEYLRRLRTQNEIAFSFTNVPVLSQTAQDTLQLPGSIPSFAHGGSMIARKPTLALFGEGTPEMAQFTPLNQMNGGGSGRPQRLQIEMSGSAPPGIRGPEMEQMAGMMVRAFREAGVETT